MNLLCSNILFHKITGILYWPSNTLVITLFELDSLPLSSKSENLSQIALTSNLSLTVNPPEKENLDLKLGIGHFKYVRPNVGHFETQTVGCLVLLICLRVLYPLV